MKPHRLTLTHNLVFNYDLHKKMEVSYFVNMQMYVLYMYMRVTISVQLRGHN